MAGNITKIFRKKMVEFEVKNTYNKVSEIDSTILVELDKPRINFPTVQNDSKSWWAPT